MVNLKSYLLNGITLSNEILSIYIDKFWSDVFNENKENHLYLLCKVKFADTEHGYRTLGHLVKINYEDKLSFLEYLSERLSILSDAYVTLPISQISFSYVTKLGKCEDEFRTLLQHNHSDKDLTTHFFNNMNLPITMDPIKYGEIRVSNIIEEKSIVFERFIVVNGDKTYQIDVYETIKGQINNVSILGKINLSWRDTALDSVNSDYFKREIKKSTIYFKDGLITLRKKELPVKAFRKLQIEKELVTDFITLDIETIYINNRHTPYLVNGFDGKDHITSFNNDEDELFKDFIKKLLVKIEDYASTKIHIYAHNLSTFDGVLMLKHLIPFGKVEPIYHNGIIISIKLIIKDSKDIKRTLIFKDSYLTLPSSLRNLCKAFNIPITKGYFPFNLSDINYIGVYPAFKYFTDITNKEWSQLKQEHGKKVWSFHNEAIKYCKLDCETLHQILVVFNELFFNKFQINIHNALTGPSLSMRTFKTHYMKPNTIYQLLGNIEYDIRQSYTGGAVDVYKPHNIKPGRPVIRKDISGKYIVLYCYDVNSLYPYIMAETLMPIGKPSVFEGNIRNEIHDAYGFFYCEIFCPDNLDQPLLQRRIKTKGGMRTVAGTGTWNGWVHSLEMDNAIKYGYQFKILKGYQFESGEIFKEYIETLYKFRMEYPKSHPMNYIAKLLMNSLYGKFGMRMETTEVQIFDITDPIGKECCKDTFELWAESIKDHIKIGNYEILVRNSIFAYKYNEKEEMFHGMDVNIAIASAITGGARVHMSKFKNNPLFRLYYSDTDSIFIDAPLPVELVGTKLGQMKLEYMVNRAVFLAPKVYGIEDVNGNTKIKIKGVTDESMKSINVNSLEKLLIENESLEFNQFKWFKKVLEGNISIESMVYRLKATSYKRSPLYINEDGFNIFTSTRPYNYNEIK